MNYLASLHQHFGHAPLLMAGAAATFKPVIARFAENGKKSSASICIHLWLKTL